MSTSIYTISEEFSKLLGVRHIEVQTPNLEKLTYEFNGGATTNGKIWITNGNVDDYIYPEEGIPNGWYKGRSNCVFNDSEKQKAFGALADRTCSEETKKKISIANKGKPGFPGKLNPACRPEVRKKISQARKRPIITPDGEFDSIGAAAKYYNVCYATINKWCEEKDGYNKHL